MVPNQARRQKRQNRIHRFSRVVAQPLKFVGILVLCVVVVIPLLAVLVVGGSLLGSYFLLYKQHRRNLLAIIRSVGHRYFPGCIALPSKEAGLKLTDES